MKTKKYNDIGKFVAPNQQVELVSKSALKANTWNRIGEFADHRWGATILSIFNDSEVMVGRSVMLAFSAPSRGSMTVLHKSAETLVNKIRLVVSNNIGYLEVYNSNAFSLYRIIASSTYKFNLYDTFIDGNIPAGAQAYEFPIT